LVRSCPFQSGGRCLLEGSEKGGGVPQYVGEEPPKDRSQEGGPARATNLSGTEEGVCGGRTQYQLEVRFPDQTDWVDSSREKELDVFSSSFQSFFLGDQRAVPVDEDSVDLTGTKSWY
jgi:hypothetical protein